MCKSSSAGDGLSERYLCDGVVSMWVGVWWGVIGLNSRCQWVGSDRSKFMVSMCDVAVDSECCKTKANKIYNTIT